jgi:hypothetical protein
MNRIGNKCKTCKSVITERTAVYKGFDRRLQSRCRYCYPAHRDSMPSRTTKARANTYRQWKWGISPLEYNKKLELQLGGCAICKQPCKVRNGLSVDHNHKTNIIRDLLCHRCNVVLGMLEEDENLIIAMVEYIKRHNIKVAV